MRDRGLSPLHIVSAVRRTGAQGLLLAIMGGTIFMLAFFEKWLGIVSVDHNKLDWSLYVSSSFSAIRNLTESIGCLGAVCVLGIVTAQKRFGGV